MKIIHIKFAIKGRCIQPDPVTPFGIELEGQEFKSQHHKAATASVSFSESIDT